LYHAKTVQSEQIFKSVGKLIVRWNDLELQLRRLLYCLAEDWFTAAALSVDMQAANLIQALKTFAAEYDADSTKWNRLFVALSEQTGRPAQTKGPVFEHVNWIVESANRLRLHRNLYAHCINSPTREVPRFTLGGMTARGRRLSDYDFPLDLREIRKVISLISATISYAQKVERCIKAAQDSKRTSLPKWPKKLPLPPELKKSLRNLSDRMPLF
jgi:hypothetical protein